MKEIAAADHKVSRRVMERDAAVALFPRDGREVQGRDHRQHSVERADRPLWPGRVVRPVPRTARAFHRQAQELQAHESRWRLLARRLAQRDAPAHLRHGVAQRKELEAYLHRLEEAEKRDHRRIGKDLDLFHFQEEAPGAVFWHPKGWRIFQQLIGYMRKRQDEAGYRRSERARNHGVLVVAAIRPPGEVRREHVPTKTPMTACSPSSP